MEAANDALEREVAAIRAGNGLMIWLLSGTVPDDYYT
jgi:hypothetical protein